MYSLADLLKYIFKSTPIHVFIDREIQLFKSLGIMKSFFKEEIFIITEQENYNTKEVNVHILFVH